MKEAKHAIDSHVLVAEGDVGGGLGVVRPDGQPEVSEDVEKLGIGKNITDIYQYGKIRW